MSTFKTSNRRSGPVGLPASCVATDTQEPPRGRARLRLLAGRIAVVVGIFAAVLVLFAVTASWATNTFAAHDHGTLDVTIDGETVVLDQPRYHELHPQFHVHPGSGNLWHHHPEHPFAIHRFEPMTLSESFEALDMRVSATTFTIEGVTYDDADADTSVSISVNGEPFDPEALVDDELSIIVEITTGS